MDKILRPILDKCTPVITPGNGNVPEYLVRSVVSQQLSTAAASTIYGRLQTSLDTIKPITGQLLSMSDSQMRSLGISTMKCRYLKEIASFFESGKSSQIQWDALSDQEIIDILTPIPGVGQWTVEMVLIFCLNREDVFPIDDLVIRQQIMGLYGLSSSGKQLRRQLLELGEPWRPYRTLACRYLWAFNDANRKNSVKK